MSSPTDICLPPSLPYPIRITSLDAAPSTSVQRGTRLLSYSFVHLATSDPSQEPETRFGTWDSSVEGSVEAWKIKPGDVITVKKAGRPVLTVIEPCKHGIQIGGLCGVCGKDMTDSDYTGWSDASRASIQMTHSAFGPTVSLEEAQRLERESADHLLKARKLSLIVDLDQTIVHATVDPTVGEWIAEGKAWEERQAKKASGSGAQQEQSESELQMPSDPDDECNPNWEALKDVKSFRLGPESFGTMKGRSAPSIQNEGCMYYVKPRPGWDRFLAETANRYEMHVYTMGTRAYAEQVCAAIDPNGEYFATRILSRDESGSLTQKNLQRLFPCDTSMVVIIDDRADVWEWSPNLIKVIPYDFFVGIGDINSAFLPKIEPLTAPGAPSGNVPPPPPPPQVLASPAPLASPSDIDEEDVEARAMLAENSIALEAQREERPLAKKQEQLQDEATDPEHKKTTDVPMEGESHLKDNPSPEPAPETQPQGAAKPVRKALLKNDDWELIRLRTLLDDVHNRFFNAYDTRHSKSQDDTNGPSGSRKKRRSVPSHDVTQIIPQLRTDTFKGLHLLFSSVIPLDTQPEVTEIWKMALMFGATCSTELTSDVTHVVAAKRGTMKVDAARRRGGIKIVWLSWFTDSIALWRRQDETPYLLDEPKAHISAGPSSSPQSDPHQISSDPEPDDDDWHQETQPSLELNTINWDDINDEVDAAMNESDDEDYEVHSERGTQSRDASDTEESMDEVNSAKSTPQSTPRLKRKRMRSATPSELSTLSANGDNGELLRSPLSKRKKLAADRSGTSKLKQGITALDLDSSRGQVDDKLTPSAALLQDMTDQGGDDDDDESDSSEEDDEPDDDFLARELGEDWG